MNKLIKSAILAGLTLGGAVSAQADSMGALHLARIAQKSGKITCQQQELLERYGSLNEQSRTADCNSKIKKPKSKK